MLYTRAKSITSQTYTPLSQTRPPYSTQHSLPKKVYHPNSHPLTRSVHRTQPTTHMNKETQPSQTTCTSIAFSRLRSQSYQKVFCSFRPNETLKFQTLLSQICQYFLLKKCKKLLQCKSFLHFFNKKYQCIWLKSRKTLNELTS